MTDFPFRKKYPFAFVGIVALTAVTFLIALDFMYSQSSGQINSGFNMYENDIHKVRIQYPSNWEQILKYATFQQYSQVYCSRYWR